MRHASHKTYRIHGLTDSILFEARVHTSSSVALYIVARLCIALHFGWPSFKNRSPAASKVQDSKPFVLQRHFAFHVKGIRVHMCVYIHIYKRCNVLAYLHYISRRYLSSLAPIRDRARHASQVVHVGTDIEARSRANRIVSH